MTLVRPFIKPHSLFLIYVTVQDRYVYSCTYYIVNFSFFLFCFKSVDAIAALALGRIIFCASIPQFQFKYLFFRQMFFKYNMSQINLHPAQRSLNSSTSLLIPEQKYINQFWILIASILTFCTTARNCPILPVLLKQFSCSVLRKALFLQLPWNVANPSLSLPHWSKNIFSAFRFLLFLNSP